MRGKSVARKVTSLTEKLLTKATSSHDFAFSRTYAVSVTGDTVEDPKSLFPSYDRKGNILGSRALVLPNFQQGFTCQQFRFQQTAAIEDDESKAKSKLFRHSQLHAAVARSDSMGPLSVYSKGLESGVFRSDPRQEVTIAMLQEVFDSLKKKLDTDATVAAASNPSRPDAPAAKPATSSSGGWWSGISSVLGGGASSSAAKVRKGPTKPTGDPKLASSYPAPEILGLYMYGGVGCGKTMLMDLFVKEAPPQFKVTRVHYHDFMLDVHASLRTHESDSDPLLRVADDIASVTRVLAMDELFVTDVADAMILNRLFSQLWDRGVVLVSTSNRAPDDLYKNGLQRMLFLPFIGRLKAQCRCHDMASGVDYRKLAHHTGGLYLTGSDREQALEERFVALSAPDSPAPAEIEVMMGRTLHVPRAAGAVCWFDFQELCGRPVAAADYLAVTEHFHTLTLQGLPVFTTATRSEAYRFVTLIDVLYEERVRLVTAAADVPLQLFANILTQAEGHANLEKTEDADVVVDDNLGFAKDRTISRLTEMQSEEYLLQHARKHLPEIVPALEAAKAAKDAKEAAAKKA